MRYVNPNSGRLSPASETRGQTTELLAGYLLASPRFRFPGCDGLTIEEVVIAEYPRAAAAGYVPSPADLARKHTNLANAIASFFRCEQASTVMAG